MGLPYAGKTSSIKTLLDDTEMCSPIAGIQLDGGMHVVEDIAARSGKLQIYTPNDWSHLMQQVNELEKDPTPFKTIWVDVVNCAVDENIAEHHVHDVPDADKRQRQIRFGESNWDVVGFHRLLIDIAEKHGVNVFFVYWATRPQIVENSDITIATQHIALSSTLSLKVTGILDVIIYIEKNPGPNPYPPRMRLDGLAKIETRVRLSPDNPLKKWPNLIENPSLSKMVRAFHGEIFTNYSHEP